MPIALVFAGGHPMGLLNQVRQWRLLEGAQGQPVLLIGARLALCASLCMALAWLLAMWAESLSWGHPVWPALVGTLVTLLWFSQAWRVWRHLAPPRAKAITLCWMGPSTATLPARVPSPDALIDPDGAWQVLEWRQAVHVRRVFDWQFWMLVHVQSAGVSSGPEREHWSWVSRADGEASAHALRALLALPARMTAHRTVLASPSAMASSP